jgi:DDE superfamily endonuclease
VEIFSSEPFFSKHVHLPPSNSVHKKLQDNYYFWPFFQDAIGAIDGSHIPASPPSKERSIFHNHKGFVSQNCLFACDFDMKFTYALTGWEGSATDAHIYQDACAHNLVIPEGKYFLADSGFPSVPGLLVPYRNTHYHLAEWRRADKRYVTIY